MKRPLVLAPTVVLSLLFAAGCIGSRDGGEEAGTAGPGGVQIGMTRQEVVQVMLDDVQALQMVGLVSNPYGVRFVKNLDGESLEVLYYYMEMNRGDNIVTMDELVPVILRGDAVVGWGWETLEEMAGSRPGPPERQ